MDEQPKIVTLPGKVVNPQPNDGAQFPAEMPITTPMRFDEVKHLLSDKPLRHADRPATRPA